ncbi:hypothetical protein [Streptomyces sp. NPDC050856]|uniref:hypothetical protein n=1 Tax=Streptomyces sp. NPDC050856 TaxID=3154939 RepID=UPI0033D1C170
MTRRKWTRTTGLVAALALMLSLSTTGCFARYVECGEEGPRPRGLTAQDLVGTYEGSPFGTLTIAADGTFTVSDWPHPDDDPVSEESRRVADGKGSWKLFPEREGGSDMALLFSMLSGVWQSRLGGGAFGSDLNVTGTRSDPRLYEFAGDPDVCDFHSFVRRK